MDINNQVKQEVFSDVRRVQNPDISMLCSGAGESVPVLAARKWALMWLDGRDLTELQVNIGQRIVAPVHQALEDLHNHETP